MSEPPLGQVNMADVAARAGVSLATVSRALRDVPGVRPDTRERVRAIAAELSYVVSPEASSLARRETGRVAVVMPRVDVWFYSTMLAGIQRALRAAGVDLLVYQVEGEAERRAFFRDLPTRRKVDAVILAALPMTAEEMSGMERMGVATVVAGGRIGDLPRVEVDDLAMARLAVDHLLDLGHTRIAMIRTSDTDDTSWDADVLRVDGYRAALRERGIDPDPELLVTETYGARAGARAMERLLRLDDPPTAVFAYSDELAVSALAALQARGLRVPEDVSLIGVDGHPLAETFGLSCVDQDVAAQARIAATLALDRVRDRAGAAPYAVVVAHHLIDRGSTGPAPVQTA